MIGEELNGPLRYKRSQSGIQGDIQRGEPAANRSFQRQNENSPNDRGGIYAESLAPWYALRECSERLLKPLYLLVLFFPNELSDFVIF